MKVWLAAVSLGGSLMVVACGQELGLHAEAPDEVSEAVVPGRGSREKLVVMDGGTDGGPGGGGIGPVPCTWIPDDGCDALLDGGVDKP